ncbi:MAG: hypothetical protein JWM55_2127 [Acidimicrobiaceae bacterium]|nr:hypothetical protein [Acidimicrobiaceae bacterium]
MTTPFSFINNLFNVEDLIRLPGTDWIIGSGQNGSITPTGGLHLVSISKKTGHRVEPDSIKIAPAADSFPETRAPDFDHYAAHGLCLAPKEVGPGIHRLYVVNHPVGGGGREAIEAYDVDSRQGETIEFTWVGAIPQAAGVRGNAVAALPDGDLVATKFSTPGVKVDLDTPGVLKRWSRRQGWSDVLGSEYPTPNGVVVSDDGQWYYVNSWSGKKTIRIPTMGGQEGRLEVSLDFMPDNIRWSDDGMLLVAGQAVSFEDLWPDIEGPTPRFPCTVCRLDPDTFAYEELVGSELEAWGVVSAAIEVDGELWVANAIGDRIAYASLA